MNSVLLERRTRVVSQNVGTAIGLTEGGGKGSHDAWVAPFIPKRRLTVHWGHNVYLNKKEKCQVTFGDFCAFDVKMINERKTFSFLKKIRYTCSRSPGVVTLASVI